MVKARVQLPAAELSPPTTGDGASPDPAEWTAWQRHQKLAPPFLPRWDLAQELSPCISAGEGHSASPTPRKPESPLTHSFHLAPRWPHVTLRPPQCPKWRLTIDLLQRKRTQEVNEGRFLLYAGLLEPPPEISAREREALKKTGAGNTIPSVSPGRMSTG